MNRHRTYKPDVTVILLCIAVVFPLMLSGQTVPGVKTSSSIKQLSESFSNGKVVQRIQISGQVIKHSGSTEDTGTVQLSAENNGSSQMSILFSSSGQRTESQTGTGLDAICQWTGTDGIAHAVPSGNCALSALWFLPAFSLQPSLLPANLSIEEFGIETVGQSSNLYRHLRSRFLSTSASDEISTSVSEQSKAEIGLSPDSGLPAVLAYSMHPDDGSPVQVAIEIRYSDYRIIDGVRIPFHIQRYINGALQLEILASSAQIN